MVKTRGLSISAYPEHCELVTAFPLAVDNPTCSVTFLHPRYRHVVTASVFIQSIHSNSFQKLEKLPRGLSHNFCVLSFLHSFVWEFFKQLACLLGRPRATFTACCHPIFIFEILNKSLGAKFRHFVLWMGRLKKRVVILRNELLMEELISTEPLTLTFLTRANWLCNEPPLAWDRYNPFRQCFTGNHFVNTSSPRLKHPLSVWDRDPASEQLRLAVRRLGSWGKHVKSSNAGSTECHRGQWGLLGHTASLSQDGTDEDGAEGSPAGENPGLCEGLLQEEWSANPLGYRRDDGMPAGISPQVAQLVHTGKDKLMVWGTTWEMRVCASQNGPKESKIWYQRIVQSL